MKDEALATALHSVLVELFAEEGLFGFCAADAELAWQTGCGTVIVTLMPHPEPRRHYDAFEFFEMLETLYAAHTAKMEALKRFLDARGVRWAAPPATPKDDGDHRAAFSYKWAAIHAGLGFIGKNDVFVHERYAQRVRISCLLADVAVPFYKGEIISRCGTCRRCVDACPHGLITGVEWRPDIRREALLDYKRCAAMSSHSGGGRRHLCACCAQACAYPDIPAGGKYT